MNLSRKPSAYGMMPRLDIRSDQKYSPPYRLKVRKIIHVSSSELYIASPAKKQMKILRVRESPL